MVTPDKDYMQLITEHIDDRRGKPAGFLFSSQRNEMDPIAEQGQLLDCQFAGRLECQPCLANAAYPQ